MSLLGKVYYVVYTIGTGLRIGSVSQFWEFFKCAQI